MLTYRNGSPNNEKKILKWALIMSQELCSVLQELCPSNLYNLLEDE